jgi:hypothetical protein
MRRPIEYDGSGWTHPDLVQSPENILLRTLDGLLYAFLYKVPTRIQTHLLLAHHYVLQSEI